MAVMGSMWLLRVVVAVTGSTCMWLLWGLCGCYRVYVAVTGLCGCYGVYVEVTGSLWLLWGLCGC